MNRIISIIIALGFLTSLSVQAQETSDENVVPESVEQKSANENIVVDDALTKALADSAYARKDYATAIEVYESILKNQGESADIYYNLGNSYYKNKNIARSILNFERARLLNPGDNDIRFNLEMAKSKAVDKVDTVNNFFLTGWIISLRNNFSVDGWARGGVFTFILMLVCIAIYLFGKNLLLRKIGFSLSVLSVLFVIIANIFAYQQRQVLIERKSAIVMLPSITVKSTPDNGGTDLFILHEGHKVVIKDDTMKEWREIQLEDGSVGWVPADVLEKI